MPPSGGTHGDTDQNRLSQYVRAYLDEHNESIRTLAARAVDPETGFALQHGYISSLVKTQVAKAPEIWRLRALAAAMKVPARMLAELAAMQWLGVEVAEVGGEDWVAVTLPAGLSEEERQRFIAMAEDIARHFGK